MGGVVTSLARLLGKEPNSLDKIVLEAEDARVIKFVRISRPLPSVPHKPVRRAPPWGTRRERRSPPFVRRK